MTLSSTDQPIDLPIDLPKIDRPISDYCRFVLRDGDTHIQLWGHLYWYGPPNTVIHDYTFEQRELAGAVRDALNERCWAERRLLELDVLRWD